MSAPVVVDNEVVIESGQVKNPKTETLSQVPTSAPNKGPETGILSELPPLPDPTTFTKAPELTTLSKTFIKKASSAVVIKGDNGPRFIPYGLIEEAQPMEVLLRHSHPGIIRYYGCQVQRGYVTGLVLEEYSHNLNEYLKDGIRSVDKGSFMDALESAVHHLHSLGWAHNDLNPSNIMVNDVGMPIVIDFSSCQKFGEELTISGGTEGWMEGDVDDYTTSEKSHDIYALVKIRAWLDNPTFDI